jgi:hypothetical protein
MKECILRSPFPADGDTICRACQEEVHPGWWHPQSYPSPFICLPDGTCKDLPIRYVVNPNWLFVDEYREMKRRELEGLEECT